MHLPLNAVGVSHLTDAPSLDIGDESSRTLPIVQLRIVQDTIEEKFPASFLNFWKTKLFCDVQFSCPDGVVSCHGVVLASQSKYLKELLTSSLLPLENSRSIDENVFEIVLPDIAIGTVKALLELCYEGALMMEPPLFTPLMELSILFKMEALVRLLKEGKKCFQNKVKSKSRKKTTKPSQKLLERKKARKVRPSDPLRPSLSCSFCGREFTSEIRLAGHTEAIHKKVLPCRLCGDDVFSQDGGSFVAHLKSKHPARHHCPYCEPQRSYCSRFALLEHVRSAHPTQISATDSKAGPFVCDVCGCGRSFLRRTTWLKHREMHYGGRPLVCTICGKEFRYSSSFHAHKQSHSATRAYQCDICGQEFKSSSNLRQHRVLHSEKSLVCSVCSKPFSRLDYLRKHERTIHGGIITPLRRRVVTPLIAKSHSGTADLPECYTVQINDEGIIVDDTAATVLIDESGNPILENSVPLENSCFFEIADQADSPYRLIGGGESDPVVEAVGVDQLTLSTGDETLPSKTEPEPSVFPPNQRNFPISLIESAAVADLQPLLDSRTQEERSDLLRFAEQIILGFKESGNM